jgi:hypothetical protein
LKRTYTDGIEKIIEKINKTNIGNDEIKINVYENKGTTIKTEIQTPDYETNFEHLITDKDEYANLGLKEKDNELINIELNKKQIGNM